jgi:hypothetical protein
MTLVDYELGRQYQNERAHEAASHRLARQAMAGRQAHVAQRLHFPTAKLMRVWIDELVGLATRRAETQLSSRPTTR